MMLALYGLTLTLTCFGSALAAIITGDWRFLILTAGTAAILYYSW